MRGGTALEVVALDRALVALALRGAGDLQLVAGRERLDRHRVADQQLADLVAELAHDAHGRGVGLLEVPEFSARERLLLAGAERQLNGLIAVAIDGPDRGHRARARLEHGHTLD